MENRTSLASIMSGATGSGEGREGEARWKMQRFRLCRDIYRFDISNRFRSDGREFASGRDTYASRYEIRKKRGRGGVEKEKEREREVQ